MPLRPSPKFLDLVLGQLTQRIDMCNSCIPTTPLDLDSVGVRSSFRPSTAWGKDGAEEGDTEGGRKEAGGADVQGASSLADGGHQAGAVAADVSMSQQLLQAYDGGREQLPRSSHPASPSAAGQVLAVVAVCSISGEIVEGVRRV